MRLIVLKDGTYAELAGCKVIECVDREYDDLDAVVKAIVEDGSMIDGRVVAEFGPVPENVTWASVRAALEAIGYKVYMERSGFGPWAQIEGTDGRRHEVTIKKAL